jgi:anthranilate/para-aminobenzoate synthase component I
VGGAITIDSDAAEEYQECQDKAATVLSIFG